MLRNGAELTVHDLNADLVAGFVDRRATAGDSPVQAMRSSEGVIISTKAVETIGKMPDSQHVEHFARALCGHASILTKVGRQDEALIFLKKVLKAEPLNQEASVMAHPLWQDHDSEAASYLEVWFRYLRYALSRVVTRLVLDVAKRPKQF